MGAMEKWIQSVYDITTTNRRWIIILGICLILQAIAIILLALKGS